MFITVHQKLRKTESKKEWFVAFKVMVTLLLFMFKVEWTTHYLANEKWSVFFELFTLINV